MCARVRVRAYACEGIEGASWEGFGTYAAAPSAPSSQSLAVSKSGYLKKEKTSAGSVPSSILGSWATSVVSLLPKRGPAPLLLMPEASLRGLPGFLFFATAAASNSACAALSLATRSACAFAASPCSHLLSDY